MPLPVYWPQSHMKPEVSVIITTRARPQLVRRAALSVLAQTKKELELIVVMDGPDRETRDVLASIPDRRLRIEVRDRRRGQAAAVNAGVALARGTWMALLDDDDEWMPEKLESQLRAAETSTAARPVVGCRFLARSASGDRVWPRRPPGPDEPIADYLFCRSQLSFGEGILPTSTLFAPTALFRDVPWDEGLNRHGDIDWLVRVGLRAEVRIELPPEAEPMAVWHLEGSDRMSKAHDWRYSREWIIGCRLLVSRRACAGFLLNWAGFSARCQRDFAAIPALLYDAFRHGRPGPIDLATFSALWCLPPAMRSRWSRSLTDRMQTASEA